MGILATAVSPLAGYFSNYPNRPNASHLSVIFARPVPYGLNALEPRQNKIRLSGALLSFQIRLSCLVTLIVLLLEDTYLRTKES